jgi:hypothetical protein
VSRDCGARPRRGSWTCRAAHGRRRRPARFAELGQGTLSAGVNHTRIADGDLDFVLYQRTFPCDHAAGVVLLAE